MTDKSPDAFRTISEVAEELDVPQHVLRFWETRFAQIRPLKRGGGRRYYRPEDVNLLRGIRHLLYGEGYTIKGVQRILKEQGVRQVAAAWREEGPATAQPEATPPQPALGPSEPPVLRPAEPAVPPAAGAEPEAADDALPPEVEIAASSPSVATTADDGRRLSPEVVRRLESALTDLVECRRLLDATRHDG